MELSFVRAYVFSLVAYFVLPRLFGYINEHISNSDVSETDTRAWFRWVLHNRKAKTVFEAALAAMFGLLMELAYQQFSQLYHQHGLVTLGATIAVSILLFGIGVSIGGVIVLRDFNLLGTDTIRDV